MQHPSLTQWEKVLKKLMDDLDDHLEDQYGNMYHLHPARPERGTTANKAHDGLFDVVASFSLGLGTHHGKGYVVDVHISTLEKVPAEIEVKIQNVTLKHLKKKWLLFMHLAKKQDYYKKMHALSICPAHHFAH